MVKFQVVRVSCIAVLIMSIQCLVGVPEANAASAITCEQVTIWLTPCIGYGVLGGVVPNACCSGIKALDAAAKTAEDRRTKCQCIKDGAARIPGLNYERVNTLPDICGTTCPYKLSPTLDCSKIN